MMNFDTWMRNKGVSESTVLKYYGAISGSLSDWARENNLISGSILDIRNQSEMSSLVLKLKQLDIVQERNTRGHGMYLAALKKYSRFLYDVKDSYYEADIEEILEDSTINVTERVQLINSRIGQGIYRQGLIKLWGRCSVTGYKNTSLLLASHIKPWSKSSSIERLDSNNGLLLIPNLDTVFDQGYISFDNLGNILISKQLSEPEFLGIEPTMSVKLNDKQSSYMNYHRENIFRG